MAPTRAQVAATGTSDAQTAVVRLEAEMADIRGELTELKNSTAGIAEIQQNMATMEGLDSIMNKYLTIADKPTPPSGIHTLTNLSDQRKFPPLSVNIPMIPNVWSSGIQVPPTVTTNMSSYNTMATTHVTTDSVQCTTVPETSHTQQCAQPTPHFQIPPISHPLPYTPIHQPCPPNPGIWPSQVFPTQPPNYNKVMGQFLPIPDNQFLPTNQTKPQNVDQFRNTMVQQLGGVSHYADAVLKGPRLEIPLITGDDPIGWLQQCDKFFDMSGTPYEQRVNIASGHFFGRANVWMKNMCIPWQMVDWQQFCQMIADRFTQANAHEAVEKLKNIQQTSSVAICNTLRIDPMQVLAKPAKPA
jgi:hypothetical protein